MAGTEATVTRELYDELKAQLDVLTRQTNELRDEFVTEDGERGTGTMSDEDLEGFVSRMDRMHNEHLIFTYLATSSLIHERLSGRDHDLMTMLKSAFLSIAARSIEGIPGEDWALGFEHYDEDGDLELDLAYLDED
jgi:hypothetical protein